MKRKWLLLVCAIVGLLSFGMVNYIREYVILPRAAQRIFKLIDNAPSKGECFAAWGEFVSQPRCLGAHAVKSEVINRLETVTNREAFFYLFGMLQSMQEQGVFFEDREWMIIRTATECKGEMPERNLRFFVTTNGNRLCLSLGAMRGQP